MKLAICSDIHLEFGGLPIKNTEGADVLILAGDICVAAGWDKSASRQIFQKFFFDCSKEFKNVIYVMGNHEHYNGDINTTYNILKDELYDYGNISLLEDEYKVLDDVVFVGQTLWTDLNENHVHTALKLRMYMNDYRIIGNGKFREKGILSPEDTFSIHKASIYKMLEVVKNNENNKVVVVGHHAPSHRSVKPRYEHDYEVNGGYRSNLEWVMEQNRNIKLWIHGHTHHEFDYMVHDTRVVCNPRGYLNYERQSHEIQPYYPLVVEV